MAPTEGTGVTALYRHVLYLDSREIVHTKAEGRRVLHVSRLANDDVDVGILIPCTRVVDSQTSEGSKKRAHASRVVRTPVSMRIPPAIISRTISSFARRRMRDCADRTPTPLFRTQVARRGFEGGDCRQQADKRSAMHGQPREAAHLLHDAHCRASGHDVA